MSGFTPDAAQQAILTTPGSRLVLGPVGSGKTTVLMEAVARAVHEGIPPADIALTTFAYRPQQGLKAALLAAHPALAPHVKTETVVALAEAQLKATGQTLNVISNNEVRRYLRALMPGQGLNATVSEAEHIVRAAKGRAKKLPEADPHYPFFNAYTQLLKERDLLDRHDLIRNHVRGLRAGTVAPVPVKLMLVDGIQDATELQLIWLKEHLQAGVTLVLAGNDDITAFGRDGAQGPAAFSAIAAWPGVSVHVLPEHYRLPALLAPAVTKVARFLSLRHGIPEGKARNPAPGAFSVESFATPAEEQAWLVKTVHALKSQSQAAGHAVGIITRDDFTAARLTHLLQKSGLNPASYARLIWEEPTPQTVLALLYVLLNQATDQQLALVLAGYGVPVPVVAQWRGQGLKAADWLPSGAPLPPLADASPTVVALVGRVRRNLLAAWQALSTRLSDPRTVFKACVYQLLEALPDHEDPEALLAADMLLSLSGNLTQVLARVAQETLPDMSSPVTVAPVREVRGRQFQTVILPGFGSAHWPPPPGPLLGADADHERRLAVLAASRAAHTLILSHSGALSPFGAELQQAVKQAGRFQS